MIVHPQLLNYRLIIGAMLAVLLVTCIFSYYSYESNKSYEAFLEQEKGLLEIELSEMLNTHNNLSTDPSLISSQFQEAKLKTKNTLDSLSLLKSDLSMLKKFRSHLSTLNAKNTILLNSIDSLNNLNAELYK